MTYSRQVKLDYIRRGIIKVDIENLKWKIEEQRDICINGDLAIGQPLEVEAGISPDLLKLWDLEEELQTAQEVK
tara:strand:+ start:13376 stop:13597 length:222 start_codon:yes stop_codon:yes gene_type:complete